MINNKDLLLYAVTDRSWCTGSDPLIRQVEEALKGGISCLQLREKELPPDLFLAEAVKIKQLCQKYSIPFIVNDDVDVALRCGADGVHVGQQDMQVRKARQILGSDAIIGVSVADVEQALSAQVDGADYLGVGAIFPTPTKPDADVVSLETLRDICTAVSIPVVAIGGINRRNMAMLGGAGVDGAALVSAIFASPDIERECRELRELAEHMFNGCMNKLEESMRVSESISMTPGAPVETSAKAVRTTKSGPEQRRGVIDKYGSIIEIKGAIFDMDGTLLDSMFIWDNVAEQYLIDRGIQPEKKINEKFRAMSLTQAALYYVERYGLKESVAEIESGINSMVEYFYFNQVKPKEGIPEFLSELAALGVKMCVATATDKRLAEAAIKRCGLSGYFVSLITCGEMGSGKDSPEIFYEALRRLGTDKKSTPVFEDAAHALATAGNAGFPTIGVYDRSYADFQGEIQENSLLYIKSFRDLKLVAIGY